MKKISFLVLFCLLFNTSTIFCDDYLQEITYYKAKILNIEKNTRVEKGSEYLETLFTFKILSGNLKGQTQHLTFKAQDNVPQYVKYKTGDVIYVGLNNVVLNNEEDRYFALYDIDNSNALILIAIVALITLLIVGRKKGIMSLIGLATTILLIFFLFVPLTLKGVPPLLLAIVISISSISFTVPIVMGLKRKALVAIIGASSGVIVAFLLSIIFGFTMHLSGIITDELLTVFYESSANINIRDIALAGMIFSALGAVMDISISISSAINEFFVVHPKVSFPVAFKSALEVGRDNLASMVNTLVMAYVGSSLSLILLIYIKFDSTMPIGLIFSHNEILIELLKSFVGCMGMFVSVPITAFVGVKLFSKNAK